MDRANANRSQGRQRFVPLALIPAPSLRRLARRALAPMVHRVPDCTPEAFWRIVDAMPEHVRAAPVTLLATGMRLGELCACDQTNLLPLTHQMRIPGRTLQTSEFKSEPVTQPVDARALALGRACDSGACQPLAAPRIVAAGLSTSRHFRPHLARPPPLVRAMADQCRSVRGERSAKHATSNGGHDAALHDATRKADERGRNRRRAPRVPRFDPR